jgi:hypothetical protein
MSAADWLALVWSDGLTFYDVFPGLVTDEEGAFTEAMMDGELNLGDLFSVAQEVLETASGLRWWFALNLSMQVKVNWHTLGGTILRAGLDPRHMPFGAFLLAFLSVCLENLKPERANTFITELNTPPKGMVSEETVADDGAAFLSAMRQAL